jgi:LuxR family maltose regulon positive regulatory protein
VLRSAQRTGNCIVVLDDAELIAPEVLRELAEAVLTELAPGSMLAIASRTEPDLPIGRLRAHRAMSEIRMKDLAMTPEEAASLLRQAGFDHDPETVSSLHVRTDGWPVALYLAALSIREFPDAPPGLARFRGDDHLLSEYLRDEVLSAIPAQLSRFLVRTSVLDELSGPLCDAVLCKRGSAPRLADIARASQLLEPRDRAHEWYRWHPLFREALAGELRRTEPELEAQLRLRASAWYFEHGDPERAIEYACAARDAQRAGELLWAQIASYVTDGRGQLVKRWLEAFGDEQIADDPRLALCAAHSCLALGDAERAKHWATAAARALDGLDDPAFTQSMTPSIAVIDAAAARAGVAGMRKSAQIAYEASSEGSPWRVMSCSLRGIAEHLGGDRERGAALLDEAIDSGTEAVPSVTGTCLAQRAMIAIEQQDWELAGDLTDRGMRLVLERELGAQPAAALVLAAAAASRAHEGRVDEAKRDLRDALNVLAAHGDFVAWYGAEARILLAHASLWLADVVGARTLLAQASRLARRTPDATMFAHWFDGAWSYMDTLAETSMAGPSALTIAELRILRFLPSHRSFREIAAQLGVSANTVKTQAHAVYRKLGAASRSEAVARAIDSGLLGQ